jgi:hypothetical protein
VPFLVLLVFAGFFPLSFLSVVLSAFFVSLFFIVFCVVGRVVFCGGVLCDYQPRNVERMVVEMTGISVRFETVVFVNRVAE